MTLRQKSLLTVFLILALLLGSVYFFASRVLFEGFEKVEYDEAIKNVHRVEGAFQNIIENMKSKSSDWAIWDDTYQYVVDLNEAYKESNLGDVSFSNLQIHFMLYTNPDKQVVFYKAYDYENNTPMEFPKELLDHFRPESLLLNHKSFEDVHSGILMLGDEPIIFTARPILTSERQGPIHGTLFFARKFNLLQVSKLSETTKLKVEFKPLTSLNLDSKMRGIYEAARSGEGPVLDMTSKKDLKGYFVLKDVYEKDSVLVSASMFRDIYSEAQNTNKTIISLFLVLGLVCVGLALTAFEVMFFTPLFKITNEVAELGKKVKTDSRLSEKGHDEITKMAQAVNTMLVQIEESSKYIKESEQKFRLLADSAPVLIWMSDANKERTYFNKGWTDFTGRLTSEQLGGRWATRIHSEDLPLYLDIFGQAFDSRKNFTIEFRLRRHDGVYRWILDTGIAMYDADGMFSGYIGSGLDITERRELEEALRIKAEEEKGRAHDEKQKLAELKSAHEEVTKRAHELELMQKANLNIMEDLKEAQIKSEVATQTKSQFLANMSHEIRTPLNAIIGFSDLLSETKMDDAQKDYLRTIVDSGEILLSIINDILDFSKIEAGLRKIENIDFNLEYLIQTIIKVSGIRLKTSKVHLYYDYPGEYPKQFNGDPSAIRQILLNFVSNAIKFTSEGEVRISVEFLGKNQANKQILKITTKDTGIGIAQEKIAEIFKPFEQADISTTRKYGGTGLGLSITKSLAELMGGKVWAESEFGKGSAFIFEIALHEIRATSETEITPISYDELAGKTVVLVDDNPEPRKLLSRYCEKAKMQVLLAADSADQVLGYLSESKTLPDLVLSDIMMPDKSGLQLAIEMRRHPEYSKIKLVAFSSAALPGSAGEAQGAGFQGYLSKPFTEEEFAKLLQTVFGDKAQISTKLITRHVSEELVFKSLKILVAEDNPVNQKLIRIMLKNLGCEVDIVSNGQEAIEKIKEKSFDLCLMDLQMPVMGGLEATKHIRNQDGKDKFPIIALTAAATVEDAEKCRQAGMDGYLTKPIEAGKLKAALLEWGNK